ncbi:crotonobetaine/carnitine-CoA ligase [Rhizobium mesoamericanum]|uniref:class I adenylate-forming enzyme family protein n=1 Tax=Rhizobium mesoamericanum TaxID=1079800 RepID=UPI002780D808|nr:AMP-binding protein [Rhizobium mesoamericanum]MDQ0562946.1 crotonobetaine/carnitine-CoA ligase [Rhizobium mesoamericanum]
MTDKLKGFIADFNTKADKSPNRVFAHFNGEAITFAELDKESGTFAANLRSRALQRGDRVAVMMRNSRLSLPVLFGIAKAGAVWVPINAQQKGEGLRYILEHSQPKLIVCDRDFLSTIAECGAEIASGAVVTIGDAQDRRAFEAILKEERGFADGAPSSNDLFAIMYTSGTTGRPKGVLVTHGMIRLAGEAVRKLTAMRPGDIFFVWEPFFHIGGAQLIILPIIEDITLAMVDRFSASRFWDQVRSSGATHVHYLGGILQILLKQPETPLDRQHSVRIAWGGGCPKDVWPKFRDRYGVEIRECYGMTEASSITTCNTDGVVGSVGKPLPWYTVSIEDEGGSPLATGDRGEIVVRSSLDGALFSGYLDNREATDKALVEGALRTGDAGTLDADGNLWFHGRMTDSVRCKGENVSAWEVEHVAAAHPAVEDCAMIGVAADVGEQDIKLFVKAKNGKSIDPELLSRWLSERLASFQNPRYIAVVGEFERTPSQRIMKHLLPKDLHDCWDRLEPQEPARQTSTTA